MDVTCDVMIIISRTNGHLWDEQWLGHINTGWQLCCYYETLVVLLSPHWFFSHSETDYKQLQQETGHPEAEDVACSSVWGNPSTNNRSWTLYSHGVCTVISPTGASCFWWISSDWNYITISWGIFEVLFQISEVLEVWCDFLCLKTSNKFHIF